MIGPGIENTMDPWMADNGDFQAAWRERERRQRTVRFLMMFLLALLLMDGEEQQQRRKSHDPNYHLRKRSKQSKYLEANVYQARILQDERIQQLTAVHPRYQQLVAKNQRDVEGDVRKWAEQQLELEKDEFVQEGIEENVDPDENKKAFHYPWNATGFYRGEWAREEADATEEATGGNAETGSRNSKKIEKKQSPKFKTAVDIEDQMLKILSERQDSIGVYLLPQGIQINLPNMTEDSDESRSKNFRSHQVSPFLRSPASDYGGLVIPKEERSNRHVTLTKSSGRAAFQLYSRSIPAMKELTLLDGFVKLYDSNTVGYSTRRDILLRVRGVLIHSIGRISLVSNAAPGRSALVIQGESKGESNHSNMQRRLEEILTSDTADIDVGLIRDQAIAMFPLEDIIAKDSGENKVEWELSSLNLESDDDFATSASQLLSESLQAESLDRDYFSRRRLSTSVETNGKTSGQKDTSRPERRGLATKATRVTRGSKTSKASKIARNEKSETLKPQSSVQQISEYVIPYPYVPDDGDQTIRKTKTPAARRMPPREQLLEANAGSCEFELNMNVQEEEWTIGQWRNLMGRHVNDAVLLDPAQNEFDGGEEDGKNDESSGVKKVGVKSSTTSTKLRKQIQDQALVLMMNGTIHSPNCEFTAALNATAIRTDWEHTTGKAINYSFYMMLTCLTQIVVLLRQLLHTQAQSAATRVSLLCIGWQTVLDALLCLVHIYLSLAMQPLFTAFASVAFFKLLIFCVIEMKYMAIIIQARNVNNGGNTTELLRRQIAMLHLRFYVALIASFLAFFYAGETYRTVYVLALYSFWVPQIIQNVITEAKRPLHTYYIYGMSLTRLVAPIYIFAVPNNFLKEVYPDSPTNLFMCEMLFLWVGIQTAVLIAQGRYGARFMIPARFLPPKFDYSRPIPASLLPPENVDLSPSESLRNERAVPSTEVQALVARDPSPHGSSGITRNRIKGKRVNRSESGMTTETVTPSPTNPSLPCFDCVICYNPIDVRNRRGYMLAPCDHLFHRECLVQWMEVKMECPICRKELPAL